MFYNNSDCAYIIQDIFHVTRNTGTISYKARDFSGIAFRFSGKGKFVSHGTVTDATAGSITYIPEGMDFDIASDGEEIIILHVKAIGESDKKILNITPSNPDTFASLFSKMYEEWQQRKIGYKNRCTSILYTVFERLEKSTTDSSDSRTELIQRGLLYMNMHFANPALTVSEIAEQCNVSEVYFRKIFKSIYGISPLRAINNLRIDHACKLLESGYYRVSEVATMSGFEDTKYFSTCFKKHTQKTPYEYLKNTFDNQN